MNAITPLAAGTSLPMPGLQLVPFPSKGSYGRCTSSAQPDLFSSTMSSIYTVLRDRGIQASANHLMGLEAIVGKLVAMADGTADPVVYLSSLEPGMGKTTAVTVFLRELVASSRHDEVGVLVCMNRLSEVSRVVQGAGLRPEDYAVFTADARMNALSTTPRNEAKILFTTQQMVQLSCRGRRFREAKAFHFRDKVRSVRVWDESMAMREPYMITTDQLGALPEVLRPVSDALAKVVEEVKQGLLEARPGTLYRMPDIMVRGGCSLPTLLELLPDDEHLRSGPRLEALFSMSGKTIRVANDNRAVRTALDYRDALPHDLAPILVLDASGRIRETYPCWRDGPGGVEMLPSPPKTYSALTVHLLDRGSGRDAWKHNGDDLLAELAALIDSKPDEDWLVIHYKAVCSGKLPREVRKALRRTSFDRVRFLTWGQHRGTNDFAHVPNIIITSLLTYPVSQYEGLAHASADIPVHLGLPEGRVKAIRMGEYRHDLLQAICRGRARGIDGDRCPPANAYIIAAAGTGVAEELPVIFPGCKVVDWKPKAEKQRKGKAPQVVRHLEQRCEAEAHPVILFAEVMALVDCSDRSNFNKTIRKDDDVRAAVAALGLVEAKLGKGRGNDAWVRTSSFRPLTEEEQTPDLLVAEI